MKITCLIDTLTRGGSQTQIVNLAKYFSENGHVVTILYYHNGNDYREEIVKTGVRAELLSIIDCKNRFQKYKKIKKGIAGTSPDVVLSYLEGPNVYSILANILGVKWKIVISERIALPDLKGYRKYEKCLYFLAFSIITNSHTNRIQLVKTMPILARKTVTIYNAVSMEEYKPLQTKSARNKILILANYHRKKNMEGLIHALAIMKASNVDINLRIDWFGNCHNEDQRYQKQRSLELIQQCGLENLLSLNGAVNNVSELLQNYDCVCLPSHYEGLPNALCEGLAAGKIILASNVCDNSSLVIDDCNGFLFDSHDPYSIKSALEKYLQLSTEEREKYARNSRVIAEKLLDIETIGQKYIEIFNQSRSSGMRGILNHPSKVPQSCMRKLYD
jgi:glycosyltransferase involved in cell wall biosynthesis